MRFTSWLWVWALAVLPGCSYEFETTDGDKTDSESAGSTAVDTGPAVDTGSGTGPGTDSGTASEPSTDSPSETPGSDDSEVTDSSSDTAAPLWLRYYESIGFMYSYGSHRILVGPAASTAPESTEWAEVADADDLHNEAAHGEWAEGRKVNLSAYRGTEIRLAFPYEATSGDSWSVVEGAGSSPGAVLWEADGILAMGDSHSEPNCMWISGIYGSTKSAHLVSAPIPLP